MTFSEALMKINDVQEDQRPTFALNKFGHLFSKDIIEYLFVRHCGCYSLPLFRYFDYIDIEHCQIKLDCITSEQVFNLVDYGPSCTFRDEDLKEFDCLPKNYNYWPNGTWPAPILVTRKDNKLLTIDGNNRLRMLRMFLKYSKNKKSDCHHIYLLEPLD